MENFSQNPFFCSQQPLMGAEYFLAANSYAAFQPFSQVRENRREEILETNVERVEETFFEGGDCEIVGSSKKRVASKQKAIPKKKEAKKKAVVKTEGEGEGEEAS